MTFKVFLTQSPSHKKAHITVAQHFQNKMSGKNYLSYPSKNGLESAVQICLYVCVCVYIGIPISTCKHAVQFQWQKRMIVSLVMIRMI